MNNFFTPVADPEWLTKSFWELRNIDEALVHFCNICILAHNRELDYLSNLDALIQGQVQLDRHQNSGMPVNTYPFGEKHARLAPRYLAVHRDGKESLNHFFSKSVLPHIDKMLSALPEQENKTVLLILDHWNPSVFEKYEATFLEYAMHHHLWTILLCVTKYGVVQIPFLPNQRIANP